MEKEKILNLEKENKILKVGYFLLLALSFYQAYNGYGAIEMNLAIFIPVVLITFRSFMEDN